MNFRGIARWALLGAVCPMITLAATPDRPDRTEVEKTMMRATRFMVEKVSTEGGFVWNYLPDLSRRWGELEARPSMIWVQPPGTATMGNLFLDAYHATGDAYYYNAALKAAGVLAAWQEPEGGWNYLIDTAGEKSLRQWYDTVGRNAWRLEEFQHCYGNATFDDAGTAESLEFLLRMYLENKDESLKPALDKGIDFVLNSQYPSGGWPQRWPHTDEFHHHGLPDYSGDITFNDDVAAENIEFLIMVYQTLGEERVLDSINRAMMSYVTMQLPKPHAGWALQYTPDLKPAGARSYEPKALATNATNANIKALMEFYRLTGNPAFLKPIPDAIDWLESVKLPPDQVAQGREYPTYVDLQTGKPMFLHRKGSNVVNGEYYDDHSPDHTIIHYSSRRNIHPDQLRAEYEALLKQPVGQLTAGSPLLNKGVKLPRYFTTKEVSIADLTINLHIAGRETVSVDEASQLISGLNDAGWWPTRLSYMSHPYRGDGSSTPAAGDFGETWVGDDTDTSPYKTQETVIGISTGTYIHNMARLIEYIDPSH